MWLFTVMARAARGTMTFDNIVSTRAHCINTLRELAIEQSLVNEESSHRHRATPGKEKS
jgi:hypothetical protein